MSENAGSLLTGENNGKGNNGASGGGASGEGAGDKGASGGGGVPPAWHSLPKDWQETLPEDIRGEALLKEFKDFPSMVKSLVHAQKAIGSEKIVIPGKNATPEDWNQLYKKLGMPAKDKYEIKAPEALADRKEFLDKLKDLAVTKGVLPGQLQTILDFFGENSKASTEADKSRAIAETAAKIKSLKEEWGAKFDINLGKAKAALNTFGDENLTKVLEASGLGNDPAIIKAFAKMGETLDEDTVRGSGSGAGGNIMAPDEAQKKITAIFGDMKHPLHNQGHAEHDNAVKEMEQLHKYAYPEPVKD